MVWGTIRPLRRRRAGRRARPSVARRGPAGRCYVACEMPHIARRAVPSRRAAPPHEMGVQYRDLVSGGRSHHQFQSAKVQPETRHARMADLVAGP